MTRTSLHAKSLRLHLAMLKSGTDLITMPISKASQLAYFAGPANASRAVVQSGVVLEASLMSALAVMHVRAVRGGADTPTFRISATATLHLRTLLAPRRCDMCSFPAAAASR